MPLLYVSHGSHRLLSSLTLANLNSLFRESQRIGFCFPASLDGQLIFAMIGHRKRPASHWRTSLFSIYPEFRISHCPCPARYILKFCNYRSYESLRHCGIRVPNSSAREDRFYINQEDGCNSLQQVITGTGLNLLARTFSDRLICFHTVG